MTFLESMGNILEAFKKFTFNVNQTSLVDESKASLKGALKEVGVVKKLILQLTQASTDAPTFNVVFNSTDVPTADIVAAYVSTGLYTLAGISTFADKAKTSILISNGTTPGVVMAESITGNLVQIRTFDLGATPALANAILDNSTLTIEYFA